MSVKTSGLQIYWLTVMGLNIRVAIRRGGDVRPKPLLLLNGIGASLEVLEGFIAAMPGCEVIIFDVPGAGKSEAPVLPWRLHTYAKLTVSAGGCAGALLGWHPGPAICPPVPGTLQKAGALCDQLRLSNVSRASIHPGKNDQSTPLFGQKIHVPHCRRSLWR